MFETVKKNLEQIRNDIAPYKSNIIGVTKYFGKEAVIAAYEVGMRDFAEGKVLDAVKKIEELPQEIKDNSTFHFIGHLQSNKVAKAVAIFDLIHSVDSLKLAKVISEEALKQGKVQAVLLQVNNAGEEQKFGFSKEELFESFKEIQSLSGIVVKGLMNMAPFGLPSDSLKQLFSEVVQIRNELETKFDCKLSEISMGMSGDYIEAAQSGATMIRIGRKLFS